jgi:hypothetical protein
MCGCGQTTPIADRTDIARGQVAGQHTKYIVSHGNALRFKRENPNPSGLCKCGCGQKTAIATQTTTRNGTVKGYPVLYIHGHGSRITTDPYKVEDRGYKTPCWIWQRALGKDGYGIMGGGATSTRVHRHYYEQKYGKIPKGFEPDHLCRVPACINPDHLEIVIGAINVQRGYSAKLNLDIVRQIRAEHAAGKTGRELAAEYNVTPACISNVINLLTWKNA